MLEVRHLVKRYAALAGPTAVKQQNGSTRIEIGGASFELVNDRAHIDKRGEGPMSLVLRGPSAKTLDTKLAHGAVLSIAP